MTTTLEETMSTDLHRQDGSGLQITQFSGPNHQLCIQISNGWPPMGSTGEPQLTEYVRLTRSQAKKVALVLLEWLIRPRWGRSW